MKTKFNGILTLILALLVQISFAQQKTVTGKISDASGPLPGVTVIVKGTKSGTQSDFDGNYSINASNGAVLQFSFIGMKTAEKTVGSTKVINVVMQESAEALEEVVITAFGSQRQAKSLGYAATKVSNDELTETSTSNPLQNLSGKVAGVDISSPAQPGASTKVVFRGISSITGSNSPLYIIDGSPIQDNTRSSVGSSSSFDAGSGLNDIDPNNIESINFLKGAAATSLYGSRGGNGVIIITTKRGKNKMKVNLSSSFDLQEVARAPHFQQEFGTGWDGKAYSNVVGEGSTAQSNENGSWGPAFNGLVKPWSRIVDNQQLIKPYVALEDNMRDFYNQGVSYTNSIGISGSHDNTDVSFTYSRVDVDGVIPSDQDSFKKNNFGINAGTGTDKFKARFSANYAHLKQGAVPTGQGDDASFGKSLIQELIQLPNDVSIVDLKDQSVIWNTPSYFYTPYASNPYITLESNQVEIEKDRFFGNANFTYLFNDKFSASYQVSTDIDNQSIKRFGAIIEYLPGSSQANATANGVVGGVQEIKYTDREFDTYLNLNYSTKINEDLTIDALAGANFNESNGDVLAVTVTDLDLPGYYELSNSATTPTITQSNYIKRVFGIYSQVELGYLEKYFLTLTARNDFSSTLPNESNSYFYPSASFAAILVDNNDIFSKFRLGYARIGNDTGAYKIFSTGGQSTNAAYYGQIKYPFAGVNGSEIFGRIENQSLKPEITDELEVGTETRFFSGRLTVDLTYYNRKTKDLIVDSDVASSTGYSTLTGNFVDLTNQGVELVLSGKPIVTDDFVWDATLTFTKNNSNVDKVKVQAAEGETRKIEIYSAYDTYYYAEEGKPLGVFYAPTPDKTADGKYIADAATGNYTYSGKQGYAGTSERDFILGFKNSFKYKDFRLNMGIDWKQGGEMYSYTKRLSYFVGNAIETTYNGRNTFIIPNSVVSDGAGGYVENTTAVGYEDISGFYNDTQNAAIEGQHMIDKTFIRLRDVSLSYSVPSDLIKKYGVSDLTLSVYGQNLFLWTPSSNSYVDPETTSYGNGIRSEFGEFAANPSQRAYGTSIKLTF